MSEFGGALDEFADGLDVGALTPEQFLRLLDTLHMLEDSGAGASLSALSTEVLARVVGRTSKQQLRVACEHPRLRPVLLREVFRRMSEQLVPERVKYVTLVVAWRFPDGEGDYERFYTLIEDGRCSWSTRPYEHVDTTITVEADDFLRMATGNVGVPAMFITGKIKVRGDYTPALRLVGYFDLPKPA
ncbi:hypothetical protein FHU38_005438 [Saccharomonospora amisosensis]|uniref:SCP2 domain-containing protein n=1 Tax=Saccharomonospora amisosensis TaxID=1128677 RepID=A0A7X5UVN4_9PSEU|nr:SCP2 sterol-binding domain-containing protein [Saccharomonospora amisosensis]NIJ15030.1 hypothetical protein [Saccharomonospora amisosensis]